MYTLGPIGLVGEEEAGCRKLDKLENTVNLNGNFRNFGPFPLKSPISNYLYTSKRFAHPQAIGNDAALYLNKRMQSA